MNAFLRERTRATLYVWDRIEPIVGSNSNDVYIENQTNQLWFTLLRTKIDLHLVMSKLYFHKKSSCNSGLRIVLSDRKNTYAPNQEKTSHQQGLIRTKPKLFLKILLFYHVRRNLYMYMLFWQETKICLSTCTSMLTRTLSGETKDVPTKIMISNFLVVYF